MWPGCTEHCKHMVERAAVVSQAVSIALVAVAAQILAPRLRTRIQSQKSLVSSEHGLYLDKPMRWTREGRRPEAVEHTERIIIMIPLKILLPVLPIFPSGIKTKSTRVNSKGICIHSLANLYTKGKQYN